MRSTTQKVERICIFMAHNKTRSILYNVLDTAFSDSMNLVYSIHIVYIVYERRMILVNETNNKNFTPFELFQSKTLLQKLIH